MLHWCIPISTLRKYSVVRQKRWRINPRNVFYLGILSKRFAKERRTKWRLHRKTTREFNKKKNLSLDGKSNLLASSHVQTLSGTVFWLSFFESSSRLSFYKYFSTLWDVVFLCQATVFLRTKTEYCVTKSLTKISGFVVCPQRFCDRPMHGCRSVPPPGESPPFIPSLNLEFNLRYA